MILPIINIILPFIPLILLFIAIKRMENMEYDTDIMSGSKCYNCKTDIDKDILVKLNNIISRKKHKLCKGCQRKETLNSVLYNKIITDIKIKKIVIYIHDKTAVFVCFLIIGLIIDLFVTGLNIIAPLVNILYFTTRLKYNNINKKSPSSSEGL